MKREPISQKDRQLIVRLQSQLDGIRRRLGIGDRGQVLSRTDLSYGDDEILYVEADGFGGGVLLVVEGNYPVDHLIRDQREFATEIEAEEAADNLQRELGL